MSYSSFNPQSWTRVLLLALSCLCLASPALCTTESEQAAKNRPPIMMGILTLPFDGPFMNSVTRKYTAGNFEDFIIPGVKMSPHPEMEMIMQDPRAGTQRLVSRSSYNWHIQHFVKSEMETSSTWSYIPRSYREFLNSYDNVETRVINVNWPTWKLAAAVEKLDGILFTGGSASMYLVKKLQIDIVQNGNTGAVYAMKLPTMYQTKVRMLLEMAKGINKSGREFILWGTCLGFESMIVAQASYTLQMDDYYGDDKIMHRVIGIKKPVETQGKQLDSGSDDQVSSTGPDGMTEKFEKFMSDEIYPLSAKKFFYYCHSFGITLKNFYNDSQLRNTVIPLALADTEDFEGYENGFNPKQAQSIKELSEIETMQSTYVTAIRFKDYPFFGTQFHPEKPLYDFRTNPAVQHTPEIQAVSKRFSDFLVNRLRQARIRNEKRGFSFSKFGDVQPKMRVRAVGIYEEIQIF